MPSAIIIAGPNGAGKTTFADEYLSAEDRQFEFVNADEIARGFEEQGMQLRSDILAGRMMLGRVDQLVQAGMNFAVETTLATRTYAQKIPAWRKRGYVVSIAYLRLGSVDESLARVRKRVEAGGHGIPEATIHRRFGKSLAYFETVYKPLVGRVVYLGESRRSLFAGGSLGSTDMSRGLDLRKATAAFERAARKAVHGTREDRSGRVISSALANVRYDRRTSALEVRFVTGRTYRYADVPADLYERLLKAESKGRFFNSHIKDRYPTRELRG